MKKLIIAAVTIALTVAANAASVKWSTQYEVGNATETGLTSATVAYFINAATLTQNEIYTAIIGGSTLDEAVAGKFLKSASMADGAIDATTFDVTLSGNLKAYMVVFDSDLNAVYFSEEMTKALADVGAAKFNFSNDSSIEGIMSDMSGFSASAGGWVSTAAVPEPTSGLLLLLGMAGLALKRKQA